MDFDKAVLDPAGSFSHPSDVVAEGSLSDEQKIRILRRWEYDARELNVAEEENMPGDDSAALEQVLQALHQLGYEPNLDEAPPTKQGGV